VELAHNESPVALGQGKVAAHEFATLQRHFLHVVHSLDIGRLDNGVEVDVLVAGVDVALKLAR
jgi:hypothetical protein